MTEAFDGAPRRRPLEAIERRVLGVLIEKAKTTPDAYPLTLKGLVTGSNQKSNRFPQMSVDEDQVEDAIDRLRESGAVAIIQGDGRVEKFRHLGYEWLGVDKVEMAVMAELLLRGAQTVGELRGRAARMEPIKGIAELGPILESLQAKSLVVYLTPPGRGAVVTHNLYQPREMEKVRREHDAATPVDVSPTPMPSTAANPAGEPSDQRSRPAPVGSTSHATSQPELEQLRAEVAHLRDALSAFRDEADLSIGELQRQIADLNRQLGN